MHAMDIKYHDGNWFSIVYAVRLYIGVFSLFFFRTQNPVATSKERNLTCCILINVSRLARGQLA